MMKLISLNIEGDKHLDLVLPFLEKEKADVICLQEVFEDTTSLIASKLGAEHLFAPMMLQRFSPDPEPWRPLGIALLSRHGFHTPKIENYWSPSETLLVFDDTDTETKRKTQRYTLASARIVLDGEDFLIATTHFTWTPNGERDAFQEQDADALLSVLLKTPEILLCGDFNMPRNSNTLYEKFSSRFADAIPAHYTSSLDMEFHRKRNDPEVRARLETYMVDYLFLTPSYRAHNVRLQSGVSDHMAIVATIERNGA